MSISFNTQPPEGGWVQVAVPNGGKFVVSTHSRPKAAGRPRNRKQYDRNGFNTQPPEGGWAVMMALCEGEIKGFNTQPPEGGWAG